MIDCVSTERNGKTCVVGRDENANKVLIVYPRDLGVQTDESLLNLLELHPEYAFLIYKALKKWYTPRYFRRFGAGNGN